MIHYTVLRTLFLDTRNRAYTINIVIVLGPNQYFIKIIPIYSPRDVTQNHIKFPFKRYIKLLKYPKVCLSKSRGKLREAR